MNNRFVSIDGDVLANANDATVSVFDTSFHRGDGVFEVMRIDPTDSSTNVKPTIRSLNHHMERLQTSAKGVQCPLPSEDVLRQWLQQAVDMNGDQAGALRLIATKGNDTEGILPSVIISWSSLPEWPETFTLLPIVAPWHPAGMPGWEIPIKWTSYGPNVVSSQKAKDSGFTDALLLSPHRVERPTPPQTWKDVNIMDYHVLDGPNFAIGFVQNVGDLDRILHLPCNETLGLLPSITQARVARIAKAKFEMKVKRDVYTLGQLLDMADEIFVMSTTRGIKNVTQIGENTIPTDVRSKRKHNNNAVNGNESSWVEKFSKLL